MRTAAEIRQRLVDRETNKLFDFGKMQLVVHLPWKEATPHLGDDVTEEEFEEIQPENSEEWAREQIEEYFSFAVEKATRERGLSAIRSVQKMREWVWLTGEEEAFEEFCDTDYKSYGAPKLKVVARHFDLGDERL